MPTAFTSAKPGGLLQANLPTSFRLPGGASGRMMTGPNGSKAMWFRVVDNLSLSTDANAPAEALLDLEMGDLETLIAFCDTVYAHTKTDNRSANFQWRLHYYSSFDGKAWPTTATGLVFGYVSANGYAQQTAFAPAGGMPLHTRLTIGYNNSAAAAVTTANVSVDLILLFRS